MKVTKTIKLLNSTDLDIIERHAKEESVTVNEVLRGVISDYADQLHRKESSTRLHTDIDDLIVANNNVVSAMNYNTIVIGEALKVFLTKYKTAIGAPDSDLDKLGDQLEDMITKKEGAFEKHFGSDNHS